ncbi:MAG: LysM peptidoglycan-binding domain-containing protein [Anaerolineae bacterium]
MMTQRLVLILCLCWLTACLPTQHSQQLIATDTPVPRCGQWSVIGDGFTCLSVMAGQLLVQSRNTQLTLRTDHNTISLSGTVALLNENSQLRVVLLEGDAVVSTQGRNRVLTAGREVTLYTDDTSRLSVARSIVTLPPDLPIADLPRSLTLPDISSTSAPMMTLTPTLTPVNQCRPPSDWTASYSVLAGDTLAQIARRHDLTTEQLADGNCLDSVERILIGQTLSVPELTDTPPLTPTAFTQVVTGFRADAYRILGGMCTLLRWDATTMQAIYLDERPVSADSSREVCPSETTTYSLRVIYDDNAEHTSEIIITVQE